LNSYSIEETDPDALQYFGANCTNGAANKFQIFNTDTSDERIPIPEYMKCFER
jgi:hypothetical protein